MLLKAIKQEGATLNYKEPPVKAALRAAAILIGTLGLIIGSVLFWGVFAAENSLALSAHGWIYLILISIGFMFATFLCLWGAKKNSVDNYLRLLVLPPATLLAMQFDDGPAYGLFYFAATFLGILVTWNILLSGILLVIRNKIR